MPFIKFLAFKYYIYIIAVIFLLSEIMPIYFYYIKKGLIYIAITVLFNCQLYFILSVLN